MEEIASGSHHGAVVIFSRAQQGGGTPGGNITTVRDANVARMTFDDIMAAVPRQLILTIHRQIDPIAGSITDEQGDSYEFAGWLAFASALEQALSLESDDRTSRPGAQLTKNE